MPRLEDPPRLLEGNGAGDAELRAALRGARADVPSADRLAAMAAHLGIEPAPQPPPGDAGASGATALSAKGLALGAGGLIAAVLAAWALRSEPQQAGAIASAPAARVAAEQPAPAARDPEARDPQSSETAHRSGSGIRTPAGSEASAAPADDEKPDLQAPARPAEAERAERRALDPEPSQAGGHSPPAPKGTRGRAQTPSPSPARAPRAPVAAPQTEVELLGEARAVLSADPARALALTELHRRKFPRGGYTQERELLAITALVRLGRSAEATERAERFRAAHPGSPYLKRIDRLTQER